MTTVFGNYSRPRQIVNIASGDGEMIPVACYGLGFDHLVLLVREYAEVLTPIYETAASGQLSADQAIALVTSLIEEVPALISMTIAFGTDAPADEMDKITALAVGAKVELIHAIIKVTMASEGGPEKIVEIVRAAYLELSKRFRPA